MEKFLIAIFSLLLLTSCWRQREEVLGYAPIYGDATELNTITVNPPKEYENGGKIYVQGTILYQVETGKGIHFTDISTPATPKKLGFIKVAGCQEIAVKNDYIYTNNFQNLVILQHSITSVALIKRVPGSFQNFKNMSLGRPPERGLFECPDPKKGTVVGWQKKTLINPKCSY